MRPHVIVYNRISVDGRVTGIGDGGGGYYAEVHRRPADAVLMGSVTAQAFGPAESAQEYLSEGPHVPSATPPPGFEHLAAPPRPVLVVPDSRGTVRNWRHAQAQPWYDGFVSLSGAATPGTHLEHLARRGVEVLRTDGERVDLTGALTRLADDFGIATIRTDCGGALTAALLAADLVDEIVVLLDPVVSGGPEAVGLVTWPADGPVPPGGVDLELVEVERLSAGRLWLSYLVCR